MYKLFLRPLLFLVDPERVHHLTTKLLQIAYKLGLTKVFKKFNQVNDPRLERQVFGLTFKNPVGLAAGFDKDAKLYKELSDLGFGFIEIGTLTPRPQTGNPKKRLFRLPKDRGLINRMGFNNQGVYEAVKRLKKNHQNILIGGNIGKNKDTPNENAVADYLLCFDALFEVVDYFVVNVSSPNTPNLRQLQDKEPLTHLLKTLQHANRQKKHPKPILLKIAPDLTDPQLLDIIEIVENSQIDGVIATNTTLARTGLQSNHQMEAGGLSGKPLTKRSTEVIRFLVEKSNRSFPIIGVGGIFSAADALEKLEAGASLVQLYTGFIYEGPGLIRAINKKLLQTASPT